MPTSGALTPRDILRSILGREREDGTHLHVIGASRSGKSRFLQAIFREAAFDDCGVAIIDWHGELYEAALNYLAYHQVQREIFLFHPSGGEWVTPYNPFRAYGDGSVSAAAARCLDVTMKSWGVKDTNQMPLLEQTARLLFHFAIAANESLPNAQLLLRHDYPQVIKYAIEKVFRDDLAHANAAENARSLLAKWEPNKPKAWDDAVGSTARRISRFLEPESLRRSLAYQSPKLDIADVLDRNAILLVNLARTREMYADEARTYAAFILSDFFDAALNRGKSDERYLLILDEFQQYVTLDMASMLDEVLKMGLHLAFAHQRLEHLARDPGLRDAVFVNARVKAGFTVGDDPEAAAFMAEQLFMSEIVADRVKDEIRRPGISRYDEVEREIRSTGKATARGISSSLKTRPENSWESPYLTTGNLDTLTDTESHSIASQLVPVLDDMVSSRTYYTIEEKRAKVAHRLMTLPQRHCYIRMKGADPILYQVPEIRDHQCDEEIRAEYERRLFEQSGAVTPEEADTHLADSRAKFLERVTPPTREKKQKQKAAPPDPEPTPLKDDIQPDPPPAISGPPRFGR